MNVSHITHICTYTHALIKKMQMANAQNSQPWRWEVKREEGAEKWVQVTLRPEDGEERRGKEVHLTHSSAYDSALCISASCTAAAQVYHSKDNLRGEHTQLINGAKHHLYSLTQTPSLYPGRAEQTHTTKNLFIFNLKHNQNDNPICLTKHLP